MSTPGKQHGACPDPGRISVRFLALQRCVTTAGAVARPAQLERRSSMEQLTFDLHPVRPTCTVEENGVRCGKPNKGHGLCQMHLRRWKLYGDPLVVLFPQNARRSYRAQHSAVERTRGKAAAYRCDTCDSRAQDWAFIHSGTWNDRRCVWDYRPLCKRCHHAYDGIGKKNSGAISASNKRRSGTNWKGGRNRNPRTGRYESALSL